MVNFRDLLQLVLFCLVVLVIAVTPVVWASNAYITLQSETTDVYTGDAIVIDIEYAGLPEAPSFERLRQAASFERETYGTRIAVIKGKVVEINIRRMEFSAEQPGIVLFGPLEMDGVLSNTIAVKVMAAGSSSWAASEQDATISMNLLPERASIYQMQTLDITLRHTFPIADEDIVLPSLDGFETRTLVSARRTMGVNSLREINWKILVFPQASGQHTIEPLTWSGTLVKSRTERAGFQRQSQPVDLTISPATFSNTSTQDKSDTSQWWLPATALQLSEEWSKDVRELTAGEEVTRTIKLEASGVTSGQLPQPNILESRSINQTLVNVERNEVLTANSINSSATFTYRVNPQSPIPVFLDTVRVPWWNTAIGENDEAIIPARRINIGLPARSDLLANLAKTENKSGLLQHLLSARAQNIFLADNRMTTYLLLICIFLSAGIIYLANLLLKNRNRTRIRSARKHLLIQLARECAWNDLYYAIDEHYRHVAAFSKNPNFTKSPTSPERTDDYLKKLKELVGEMVFQKPAYPRAHTPVKTPGNDYVTTRKPHQLKKQTIINLIKSI